MDPAKFAEMVGGSRYAVAPPIAAAGDRDTTRVRFERHAMQALRAEL